MRIFRGLLCAGVMTCAWSMGAPAAAQTVEPAVASTGLSPLESLWHVRAALNVAALGCRDGDEAATVAAYNALIRDRSATLAAASDAVGARYKAQHGAGWQGALDRDMTKLYNHFAQPTAQADFCNTAKTVLTQIAAVEAGKLAELAVDELAALEAPFADQGVQLATQPLPVTVVAISAAVPVGPPLPR